MIIVFIVNQISEIFFMAIVINLWDTFHYKKTKSFQQIT